MSIIYYPILKWKKGEQDALKNLNYISENFYPIVEIVDPCTPNAFFDTLKTCYDAPIYFDTNRFETEYINNYTAYAKQSNIQAYPVLYVENLFDSTINIPNKFSVKIPIPVDFEGPSFDEILDILSSYQNHEINLILDAGEVIDSRTANSTFDSFSRTLSDNINVLCNFENIIICLTSFPKQLMVESGDDITYKRFDILIFKKLIEKFRNSKLEGKLQYSDYGVTKFTETELDFSRMRYGVLPKVKYTTNTEYIVKKGEKDRRHNIFTRSYIDIAKEIVNSSYFFGQKFSYGDKCIYEKAYLADAKPGNPQQWVTYCANHHLTVVTEQLSNLAGS